MGNLIVPSLTLSFTNLGESYNRVGNHTSIHTRLQQTPIKSLVKFGSKEGGCRRCVGA